MAAARMLSQLSRRCTPATTTAPKVPNPAASTGVAMPAKMMPRTSIIRAIGAGPMEQFDRGKPDIGAEEIDQAGDEERDFHDRLLFEHGIDQGLAKG